MASLGINRVTGKWLTGFDHVVQSIQVIMTTRIGDRGMRRNFGSAVPGLLGKNLTEKVVLRFYMAMAIAIDLWEPRYRLRRLQLPVDTNSPARFRQGKLGLRLYGDYRPRALEGDFTIEGPERKVSL